MRVIVTCVASGKLKGNTMVIIKELIRANVKSLEAYSRSKAAKDVKTQLEAQDIVCDRGVMSTLYNELDAWTRELNKQTEFSTSSAESRASSLRTMVRTFSVRTSRVCSALSASSV